MPRKLVALVALALPILGMAGLFGWAATVGRSSPVAAVNQYIAAFDARDCTSIQQVVPQSSTARLAAACTSLHRSTLTLSGCKVAGAVPEPSARLAGLSDVATVQARCTEVSGAAPSRSLALTFTVGTEASSGNEVVANISAAP
ncbi:MAG: hypothetical protein ACRDZP_04200 [Acidimicrobiales bacterium]